MSFINIEVTQDLVFGYVKVMMILIGFIILCELDRFWGRKKRTK